MNLNTYYTHFFFLLGEAKVLSHASRNSDFKAVLMLILERRYARYCNNCRILI